MVPGHLLRDGDPSLYVEVRSWDFRTGKLQGDTDLVVFGRKHLGYECKGDHEVCVSEVSFIEDSRRVNGPKNPEKATPVLPALFVPAPWILGFSCSLRK